MKTILTVFGLVLVIYLIPQVLPDSEPKSVKKNISIEEPRKFWFKAEPGNLKLINNMIIKRESGNEATISGCFSGINAFFYDKNNKPLGWLVLNKVTLGKYYKSRLLNGLVYVAGNRFLIDHEVPDNADFGHQTGPLLVFERKSLANILNSTNFDPRSVAIQTGDNKAVFAYFEEATLAELPEKIFNLGEENDFEVKNAINLDGGSSASFWTKDIKVSEMFLSGGWWCNQVL